MSEHNTPLYVSIKNAILAQINNGEFEPGDRLPTEVELQDQFDVSRSTIRKALYEIELEDRIKRQRGVGTIVKAKKIKPELMKLTGYSQLMRSRGMKPATKTLHIEIVKTPNKVRTKFDDQATENVWYVKRLCFADERPIGLHDLYLPININFAPNDLLHMKSFHKLLREQFDIIPTFGKETLSAIAANKEMANLLQVPEKEPLMDIWRTTYDQHERIIEVVRMRMIAHRYEYQFNLYP